MAVRNCEMFGRVVTHFGMFPLLTFAAYTERAI